MKKRLYPFLLSCLVGFMLQAQTIGLIQNTEQSYNGYTLFSSGNSKTTYLIDNCGNVINTWTSEYTPGSSVYLLENGNLLHTARLTSSFNAGGTGGRLELFDWDGELLWAYNYSSLTFHQHHDVEPLPNGNILLLAWDNRSEAAAIQAGRDPEMLIGGQIWSEKIVELKPVGTDDAVIVWEWYLWDHLIQDFDPEKDNFGIVDKHPELMDINFVDGNVGGPTTFKDWIHFNAIAYNTELDQIAISSRHLSEIMIIDHSTTTEEAASHQGGNSGKGGDFLYRWGNPESYRRGTDDDQLFFGQHDVRWIPEGYPDAGKIMVFNNGIGRPGPDYSTVDIIDPPLEANGNYTIPDDGPIGPAALSWTYAHTPTQDMYSSIISGASRLPNGNTLICEGRGGHLREVDLDGSLVWEYIVPTTGNMPNTQGNPPAGNETFRATRYPIAYPAFEDKQLDPGLPIEFAPINQDCIIYENTSDTNYEVKKEDIVLMPNPFVNYFRIKNPQQESIEIKIVDVSGRKILEQETNLELTTISTHTWPNSIYFVIINLLGLEQTTTYKIIKGN